MATKAIDTSDPTEAIIEPRLLNLKQVAAYLGCSAWTARDYVLAGYLPVVTLPGLRPRDGERPKPTLRRWLVDRVDLDRFIESRKSFSEAAQITPAMATAYSRHAKIPTNSRQMGRSSIQTRSIVNRQDVDQ